MEEGEERTACILPTEKRHDWIEKDETSDAWGYKETDARLPPPGTWWPICNCSTKKKVIIYQKWAQKDILNQ